MSAEALRVLLAGALLLAGPLPGQATMVINNVDPAGIGLNDPTPVSPVGGNTGTTLGQQRLIALRYAASLWAERLNSKVPITVNASFSRLPCSSTTATLAQAGPTYIFSDFAGAVLPGTWYPFALANAQAGTDLNAGIEQVDGEFTTALEDGSCSMPLKWYYGLDRLQPAGTVEFVSTAEHELAHGLGFLTFVDPSTGALQPDDTGTPLPDVFMANLLDTSTGKAWTAMKDAERAASATNSGGLVWSGPAVTATASAVLQAGTGTGGRVRMYAPKALDPGSSVSHWDTALYPNELMEPYQTTYPSPLYGVLVTGELMTDIGWPAVAPVPSFVWLLPSSSHSTGAFGAFYTTDLTIANTGTTAASVSLRFVGHDVDGTTAPVWPLGVISPGAERVLPDVLGTLFGIASGFGGIVVTSDSASLAIASRTSTPNPDVSVGGSFGQSVPGVPRSSLVAHGSAQSLLGIRDDGAFRTNLVLANGSSLPITVHGDLLSPDGALLASADWSLPPLGMTQVGRVVQALLGPAATLADGQLVLATPTVGGAFTSFLSVIDDFTNDPRTILPQ